MYLNMYIQFLGRGNESKLNNAILKHWTEVLRRYVDNIAERELQLPFRQQLQFRP